MKWAQAGVILRARLPQANVAADNADNVGLLLEGLREVVGECHELGRNPENGVAGIASTILLRNIAQHNCMEKMWERTSLWRT